MPELLRLPRRHSHRFFLRLDCNVQPLTPSLTSLQRELLSASSLQSTHRKVTKKSAEDGLSCHVQGKLGCRCLADKGGSKVLASAKIKRQVSNRSTKTKSKLQRTSKIQTPIAAQISAQELSATLLECGSRCCVDFWLTHLLRKTGLPCS